MCCFISTVRLKAVLEVLGIFCFDFQGLSASIDQNSNKEYLHLT